MTAKDLYRIIREAAEVMPEAELKINRLNCFAVVRNASELNAENLNKNVVYKDKEFFFSRRWAARGYPSNKIEFDFPAVIAIELPGAISMPFTKQRKNRTRLQLSAVFPNEEILGSTQFTRPKTPQLEEIYKAMLDNISFVLEYISGAVNASIDGGAYEWHNKEKLEYLKTQSIITSYQINQGATATFLKQLNNANQQANTDYLDDVTAFKLVGRSIVINLTESCSSVASPSFVTADCCKQIELA